MASKYYVLLSRWALAVYFLVIGYCSLIDVVPNTGWHTPTVPLWHFLLDPWLPSLTLFDVTVNIAAYVPIGLLAVWALPSRLSPRSRLVSGVVLGFAFSFAMESLQMWRPSRDPSPVDLFTNTLGSLFGAGLAAAWQPPDKPIESFRGALNRFFKTTDEASVALIATLLWVAWQLAPFVPKVDGGHVLNAIAPLWRAMHDGSQVRDLALLHNAVLIIGLGLMLEGVKQPTRSLTLPFASAVLAVVALKPLIAGAVLTAELTLGACAGLLGLGFLRYLPLGSKTLARLGIIMLLLSYLAARLSLQTTGATSLSDLLATTFVAVVACSAMLGNALNPGLPTACQTATRARKHAIVWPCVYLVAVCFGLELLLKLVATDTILYATGVVAVTAWCVAVLIRTKMPVPIV